MMRNILFVLHNDFSCNSAVHIHNFANHLAAIGLDCVVAVPRAKESVAVLSEHHYKVTEFSEIANLPNLFADGRGPDLVHAWTPREVVRKYYDQLRKQYSFELIIQLEDNEELLTEKFLQRPFRQLTLDKNVPIPDNLAHPQR
jgi:hypothetical protein